MPFGGGPRPAAVSLWLFMASPGCVGDRLTARCKLTWLAHSLQPSACPSLSLRNVSLGDSDQMQ